MHTPTLHWIKRTRARLLWSTLAPAVAVAQVVSPVVEPKDPKDDVVELSPFLVGGQRDTGYQANSTLSGTRLRTHLGDVAAPIQIVTKEMLQDTGSRNVGEILVYTTGTEVGGLGGNFSATGATSTEGYTTERNNFKSTGTRVRGLAAADLTRDYFPTSVAFDSYNTERIEINRGANSALFGLGSPAGIINNSLIAAQKRDFGSVELHVGEFGSHRESFDVNVSPGGHPLSFRLAGVYDHQLFQQEPAFSTQRRGFATVTWDAPFAKRENFLSGLSVRANYEQGRRDSRLPRTLPPVDVISQWFKLGRPTWDSSSDNLATANRQIIGHNLTYSLGTFYGNPNSATADLGMVGLVQTARPPSATTGQPIFAAFAAVARVNTALALANGNPFIIESVIKDTNVFDYKNYLIDGPNKSEFNHFNVLNVATEARFWHDRLGVELAYNTETLEEGAFDWLRGQNNDSAVHIDINTKLYDGRPNPNYGRPYLVSKGAVDYNETTREMKRATAYLNFDTADYFDRSIAKWVGKHVLTLAGVQQSTKTFGKTGFPYVSDGEITKYQGAVDVKSINNGVASIVSYLGPSVLGAGSLADVRLSPVTVEQRPDLAAAKYLVWNPSTQRYEVQSIGVIRQDPENLIYAQSASRGRQKIDSQIAVLQSTVLDESVVLTSSWREDRSKSYSSGTALYGARGEVLYDESHLPLLPTPILVSEAETIAIGGVARLPRELRQRWRWLAPFSVFLNKSENFQPSSVRSNAYGAPIAPPGGRTKDYGVAVSLANGRLDLRTTWYETDQTGVSAGLGGVIEGMAVLEARVLSRIAQGVLAANVQGTSPGITQAELNTQVARYQASPWAHAGIYNIRVASGFEYTFTTPTAVNDTYDLKSKGVEFEAVYNPMSNWRIALNLAKQETLQTNTGTTTLQFIQERAALWSQTGDLPTTPSFSSNVRIDAKALLANYYRVAARDGSTLPEVAKWRANLLTNYQFAHGVFKGFGVGGAYRWEDRVGAGYQTYLDTTLGIYRIDAAKPFWAPRQDRVDAWLSYERRLSKKVNWKIQLNVRNLADVDPLVPIYYNPDGQVATARITEGRRWDLMTRFEF